MHWRVFNKNTEDANGFLWALGGKIFTQLPLTPKSFSPPGLNGLKIKHQQIIELVRFHHCKKETLCGIGSHKLTKMYCK
jgi:hypothetical protein